VPYSQSVVADYVNAFYEGYNFADYSFAQECLDETTSFMDQLYQFHLNMTRRREWRDPYFLVFDIVGNEFNDSWFFCYQLGNDIYNIYKEKVENFVDFGDVYLSFIFNLLANSLQIKNASENMVEAVKDHNTELLMSNIAKICRITLDFDSYQTAGSALSVGASATAIINAYFD